MVTFPTFKVCNQYLSKILKMVHEDLEHCCCGVGDSIHFNGLPLSSMDFSKTWFPFIITFIYFFINISVYMSTSLGSLQDKKLKPHKSLQVKS